MAIIVQHEKEPAPGHMGVKELYAVGIGTVIGAGVITLIVPAIKMTGLSAWLAYAVAIALGVVFIAPYFFISATLRIGGGVQSMLTALAGPRVAGMYAFVFLTQCFGLSTFGTATAEYLGDIIPFLGSPIMKIVIGVAMLTVFYVINLMGMDCMAKVQKPMVWLLIASLLMFIGFGLANMREPIFDTSNPQWLTQGWGLVIKNGRITGGFLGAALLFLFSTTGFSSITGYGRNAKDARRDVPKVLLLCIPTLVVLYVGVAMAGAGTMSLEEYGNSTTLIFAAQRIFPRPLYYLFIIGGPIMALLSTLNTCYSNRALNVGQSVNDGWLPKWFGKRNKYGAPVWVLTYFYVIGVIPVLFGLSVTVLTNMIQLVTSFFNILNFFAFIKLPTMYPNAWKRSRLHIPNWLYYVICCLSFALSLVSLWKTCLSIPLGLAIGNVIVILVLCVCAVIRSKGKNDIFVRTSVWSDSEEEDMAAVEKARAKV